MFANTCRTILSLGALACLLPAISACGSIRHRFEDGHRRRADGRRYLEDAVGPERRRSLYGFYNSHCTDPGFPGWASGSAAAPSWSIVASSGFALPSGAPPAMLLLQSQSADCKLVLTDVILTDDTDLTIAGGAGLPMNNDGTYQATPRAQCSPRRRERGHRVHQRHGGINLGVPFATDFNVDLDISDTVGTAHASGSGQVAVSTTGFPNISGVLAPDYTASVTVGDLLTNSSNVVISDDTRLRSPWSSGPRWALPPRS